MNKEDLEIEALVSDYKNGNQEAGAILLSKYGYEPNNEPSKLIGKYYNLLIHGRVNLRDKDTRRFLQLYMSKKESREGLTYHYTSFSASKTYLFCALSCSRIVLSYSFKSSSLILS